MPNRQLSASELKNLARPLLAQVRARLAELADGDIERKRQTKARLTG